MKVNVPAGKYVLAVSGGVDSMVLLDLLSKLTELELVVSHFDHGIRPDSGADQEFVAAAAADLGLAYETARGKLGAASEETARKARYEFLEKTRAKHGAGAIITAHHQDDMIETAFINLLRGTGRRGLTAIASNEKIFRPLLGYSKKEIIAYANEHKLSWREDPSNQRTDYLRNYLRQKILPNLDVNAREKLLKNLNGAVVLNKTIDKELGIFAAGVKKNGLIDRSRFSALPAELGDELLVHWLRKMGLRDFDKRVINRANTAIRTAKSGTVFPIKQGMNLKISQKTAVFARSPLR